MTDACDPFKNYVDDEVNEAIENKSDYLMHITTIAPAAT